MLILVAGLPPAAVASRPLPQPTSGWTELNESLSPHNNSAYAFAWGTPPGQAPYGLLFGGRAKAGAGGLSNQTWIFRNDRWSELNLTVGPGSAMHPALAWDPKTDEFIEFGGTDRHGYLNDTWAFADGRWTRLTPTVSPPARRSAAMAYDPARGQIILFGGHSAYPGEPPFDLADFRMYNDTWAFTGSTWTNLTSEVGPAAPEPMSEPQLAWDPAIGALIEFGGYNYGVPMTDPNGPYQAYNATWALYGGRWHNLSLAHAPSVRDGTAMVWDPVRGGVLLFGGQDESALHGHNVDNDTWLLVCPGRTTCAWSEIPTTSAPPREDSMTLVWDTQSQQAITFGGVGQNPNDRHDHLDFFDGTWAFD